MGIGDCGLGIEDWGVGIEDWGLGIEDCGLGIEDCGLRASCEIKYVTSAGFSRGWQKSLPQQLPAKSLFSRHASAQETSLTPPGASGVATHIARACFPMSRFRKTLRSKSEHNPLFRRDLQDSRDSNPHLVHPVHPVRFSFRALPRPLRFGLSVCLRRADFARPLRTAKILQI